MHTQIVEALAAKENRHAIEAVDAHGVGKGIQVRVLG